jgi:hypothetical protein
LLPQPAGSSPSLAVPHDPDPQPIYIQLISLFNIHIMVGEDANHPDDLSQRANIMENVDKLGVTLF